MKESLLATVGHDLRAPLNAILGFTGTLLMELPGPLNEEQRKQLEIVQASGRDAAAGFDGYISKPIEPQTFVAEIERFLREAAAS
jgi:signal transduction histidine kinase